jgi:hypothetical protein
MGRPFGRETDREGCRAAESSAGYAYADEHALGAHKSVGVACGHADSIPSLSIENAVDDHAHVGRLAAAGDDSFTTHYAAVAVTAARH